MANPKASEIIKKAASYIGVSGTDNIFNTWYWGYHCYDSNVYPWCAVFQSYVFKKGGYDCVASASAAGFANQFERIPVSKEGSVRPGDVVVFNWDGRSDVNWCDHVGLVEWATIDRDGRFGTIEGNTGNTAGGEVARVTRTNWGSYFTAFFRPKYAAEGSSQGGGSGDQTPSKAKKLFGIDVSSNQSERVVRDAQNDFAIVKVSGNPHGYAWNYVNPYAAQQLKDGMSKHGLVGGYHFTYGKDAVEEADFFISQFKKLGLDGKCWPVIDYEAQALALGASWVKRFADRVYSKLGVKPLIYASGSVIVQQNLFSLGYPVWCANYYKGYEEVDGRSTSGMQIYPGCEKSVMWQFTSQGKVKGYGGPLDCNVYFGSADDFKKSFKKSSKPDSTPTQKPDKKTVEELAKEVIAGKWGNGADRKKKLEAAGYSYDKVQAKVNEILGAGKSVETLAKEVINGKWGNGEDRKNRLRAAGYDYDKVQKKVNELLGAGKSVDQLAREVIRGEWGNGNARKTALENAGYDYYAVQARVNELM